MVKWITDTFRTISTNSLASRSIMSARALAHAEHESSQAPQTASRVSACYLKF